MKISKFYSYNVVTTAEFRGFFICLELARNSAVAKTLCIRYILLYTVVPTKSYYWVYRIVMDLQFFSKYTRNSIVDFKHRQNSIIYSKKDENYAINKLCMNYLLEILGVGATPAPVSGIQWRSAYSTENFPRHRRCLPVPFVYSFIHAVIIQLVALSL